VRVDVDGEGTDDDCGAVVLEDAVARGSTAAVSFVGWLHAGFDTLQRSRKSVHLRSDAPIAGIAWLHCLDEPWSLRNGVASVVYTHEQPQEITLEERLDKKRVLSELSFTTRRG
jgi:hypothetical protein